MVDIGEFQILLLIVSCVLLVSIGGAPSAGLVSPVCLGHEMGTPKSCSQSMPIIVGCYLEVQFL